MLEGAEDEGGLRIAGQLGHRLVAPCVLLVGEVKLDGVAGNGGHFRFGVVGNGHVDGAGARMEEVQRPEVEGAASKVGAHRRPDSHFFHGLGRHGRRRELPKARPTGSLFRGILR